MTADLAALRALAEDAKAWPFKEARALAERFAKQPPVGGTVLFETGYGPSGLPHIGTFGEVARTTMVRHAFSLISDLPTRLIAFSDDMDGLRGVPDNIPNGEAMTAHLGKPLTQVPDPFGTHESFGHHNNARLRAFLDAFGFDYEFKSATEAYQSGEFDAALLDVLAHHEDILAVTLPTLGASCRSAPIPGRCCKWRSRRMMSTPARCATRTTTVRPWSCRSPAAIASCNGRRIGRCAGMPRACITKWRARI